MSLIKPQTKVTQADIEETKKKKTGVKVKEMWPLHQEATKESSYEWDLVWRNITVFITLHVVTIYGLYLMIAESKYGIFVFSYMLAVFMATGVTAGAHRLWAHRSYKAKLPLRLFLLILQTAMFQNSVFVWVRDHRLHHKYTDTNADPHNAKRGFFFSHIGWLLCRKHKDILEKGKSIDMTDIEEDALLMFQHRYYLTLMPIFAFVLPTLFVQSVFSETLFISFLYGGVSRYTFSVNYTWLVNSAAHLWGMKPYDKSIGPVESPTVSFLTNGEGFHNYHHVFPWDYKAAELGHYSLNLTLVLIDFCAMIGLAYDLKTVSPDIIQRRVKRTGDGSWAGKFDQCENDGEQMIDLNNNHVWGWGDKAMDPEEVKMALIYNKVD